MTFIRIILTTIFFLIVSALIIQNWPVFSHGFELKLDLLFVQFISKPIPNITLIGGSFILGVLFAILWGAFYAISMRGKVKEQEKEIKSLKQGSLGLQLNPPKEEEKEVRKAPF